MKTTTLLFGFVLFAVSSFGQSSTQKYPDLIRVADSLYNVKDFKNSAFAFSRAFKANGWKASSKEHYNAAIITRLVHGLWQTFRIALFII